MKYTGSQEPRNGYKIRTNTRGEVVRPNHIYKYRKKLRETATAVLGKKKKLKKM